MSIIKNLIAKEIFDSRGNPTLEVTCVLESNNQGSFSVPSGASTGSHEALELRDGDSNYKNGKGVFKAIDNVNNEIKDCLIGKEFDQQTLDLELIKLDGTFNKMRLGGNAILGVSISFAKAVAKEINLELYDYLGYLGKNNNFKLPLPSFNIINGGKHSNNGLDIQEFMICPVLDISFNNKVTIGKKIVDNLKRILEEDGKSVEYGDEGGFSPILDSNKEALDYIIKAINQSGFNTDQVKICLDVAASSFYNNNCYSIKTDGKVNKLSSSDLIDWYKELVSKYPIISIEDPFMEEDWESFCKLKNDVPNLQVVGDDLTVTNIDRIKKAKEMNSINAVIIKPNQIGTVSETIQSINYCKENNIKTFASHRSGETMDTFISDLSVGMNCDYIKTGAPTKKERLVKYERLMEIEKNHGNN